MSAVTGACPTAAFWGGKRVLLTGHTGFKGTWAALWLAELGAEVTGLSDAVLPGRSLFTDLGTKGLVADRRGDVCDAGAVRAAVAAARPQVVLHMAAQSLVRRSYAEPMETFAANVMGTVSVLDAVRRSDEDALVLVVTSDKCYAEGTGTAERGYREDDPLGGHDPYSASKACAEIVAAAYARSFTGLRVVSARAGNVVGGGDWAEDRLVPDLVRGLEAGRSVPIRRPDAVRPWQHVLEPLCGYLVLCERAAGDPALRGRGWNLGPGEAGEVPVRTVADAVCQAWGGAAAWHVEGEGGPREAPTLRLDAGEAHRRLGWAPRWDLARTVEATVALYRSPHRGEALRALALDQVAAYSAA